MTTTKVRVGRLILNESTFRPINETPLLNSGRQFDLVGIETNAGHTFDDLRRIVADVNLSYSRMVEVVFDSKTDRNGYYKVAGCEAKMTEWQADGGSTVTWQFNLERIGSANDIDIESRLSGSPSLLNDFSVIGERWHAPPIGHLAYWSGSSAPSQVLRSGSEGAIVVYRDIDPVCNPRFHCTEYDYRKGRVRILDHNGFERTGTSMQLDPDIWSMDNSLIRVKASSTSTFEMASWDYASGSWETKNFSLSINGVYHHQALAVSVLQNEYECITLRLLWDITPSGRTTADITLRRGSRFVEIYARTMLSATIGLQPSVAELGVRTDGRMVASANDAAGNKYILGSARTFGWNLAAGYIAKSDAIEFDFFAGIIVGGTGAVAGDQEIDLYEQYLGSPAETVVGVRQ